MNTRTRCAAWILGWIFASCGFGTIGAQLPRVEPPPTLRVDPPLTREEVLTNWRWIGLRSENAAACPEPDTEALDGWKVEPLFPAVHEAASSVLARFCLYEGPAAASLRLQDLPGLSGLEPDFLALARSGQSLDALLWKPQTEHFLAQVGEAPLPLAGSPPRVRLAFLDTQPTALDAPVTPGNSLHGFTLAHIARRLVCNEDGRCAARIASELALSVTRFERHSVERDTVRGGYMGTVGDLAQALVRAIERWDRDRGHGGEREKHLVLNLSLGWDGKLFGGLEEQVQRMPLAMQAVYRALEYAASRGDVLVIAAAGNGRLGPQPGEGALLPAAWESRVSPRGPLVYAAGGVRSDGQPLLHSRSSGTPRRVTYAEQAVVAGPHNQPTAIYTGTSVSAAVISAVAATVWHFRPDLDRRELMRLIDGSGNDLGRPADFSYPGVIETLPTVRRITQCSALARACQEKRGACPERDRLPSCKAWARRPPALRASLSRFRPDRVIDAKMLSEKMTPLSPPCSVHQVLHAKDRPPKVPCPIDQRHDIAYRPWTGTQPPEDPCPNCTLTRQATLNGFYYDLSIAIKPTMKHCMKSLDLYLNGTSRHWEFGATELCAGETMTITGISPDQMVSSADKAFTDVSSGDLPFKAAVINIVN